MSLNELRAGPRFRKEGLKEACSDGMRHKSEYVQRSSFLFCQVFSLTSALSCFCCASRSCLATTPPGRSWGSLTTPTPPPPSVGWTRSTRPAWLVESLVSWVGGWSLGWVGGHYIKNYIYSTRSSLGRPHPLSRGTPSGQQWRWQ